MKRTLTAETKQLVVEGLNKLREDKYNKYKRMGTPQTIEALDEYKKKLEDLNELDQLIAECTDGEIAIDLTEKTKVKMEPTQNVEEGK